MSDYISKRDVMKALCRAVHKKDGYAPCDNQTVSCLWTKTRVCDYAREIYNIPSADVIPVIRCKNCEHYIEDKREADAVEYCMYWHNVTDIDGHCYMAERREDV